MSSMEPQHDSYDGQLCRHILAKEQSEHNEEVNESTMTKEILGVGKWVNICGIIYNADKKSVYEPPANETPP